MKTKTIFIQSLCLIIAALHATAEVAQIQAPDGKAARSTKPSLSEPWEFVIEPYGWAMGVDGKTGIHGFTTNVAVNPDQVIQHLDWAAFLALEVRKGRWGLMADGFLAQLSAVGDPPGPFYYSANVTLKQGLAEMALAYRVVEGKYGWLDLFAGARYNYIGLNINASVDSGGIQHLSENTSERVAGRISNLADAIIAVGPPPLEDELRKQLEKEARHRIEKAWDSLPHGVRDFLRHPAVSDVLSAVADETRALAKAVAQEKLAAAGSAERKKAEQRAKDAEQELANALSSEIKNRLRTTASTTEQWVDPIVGFRTQINLTEQLFLAMRGDIGGFGLGSELALQAIVSLGYNFSKNVFAEAGYRYLHTNYVNNGFTFDVGQGGPFMGLGIRF